MKFGSVCSGIEAASVAWHPLGWRAAWLSEIEPFPCAVLAHHYPDVPNLGDMTKFKEWPDAAIDVLVGGTPCQSFSVAGLRAGLADPRGNLMLTYLAIAAKYRPRWLAWENVPGVLSSNGGRDFGTFLRGLGELGYGFAYRVLDAQYCRVDGFPHAVPQRRRRVFVVGYLGDWRRAAAVLFDGASLRGDSAPRRQAGQGVATDVVSSLTASGRGVERTGETRGQDPVVAIASTGDIAHCLKAGGMGRPDYETETMVAVAGTLGQRTTDHPNGMKSESDFLVPVPFDTTQITSKSNYSSPKPGDPMHPLAAGAHAPAIAIQERAVSENLENGPQGKGFQPGIAYTLEARNKVQAVQAAWAVRRLTPTECERLQAFPDGYTAVPYRNKPAADGPRYKALGNSMAVNVMRWLGERIALVDAIETRSEAA
jgi:DNA (cytosine-5)-methyltransferase 1